MGWSFEHVPPGTKTIDILKRQIVSDLEIIGHSKIGTAVYLAIRDSRLGTVGAYVVLIGRNSKEYCNFGTKWIDENMGPVEIDCPAKILDLLTPTDHPYATAWRAACRSKLADRAKLGSDLTGKRVKVWGKIYLIMGRGFTRGSYNVVSEADGQVYKLSGKALKAARLVENIEQNTQIS